MSRDYSLALRDILEAGNDYNRSPAGRTEVVGVSYYSGIK
jgi:hypothetical protein